MTLASYDAEIEDSGREARSREQQALNHGIALLQKIQSGVLEPSEEADALLYIRNLWTFFIQDLSSPRNGLPEQLRVQLISIGLWVIKEAERLRDAQLSDVSDLVAINIVIRDSLA
ncbi:flagellar biosynthesis regulator FlaF [Tardiphaga sp. P9-11]|jgi:flagellar protein FlaF|uniref:flagellar biosynthesis regulator FlaF n=1 Tax=Tardiphaga sp. P9-11 TaxID=2024614 RepID=UPI0011F1816A|nr:flagellar biosynthesis regulator FlaF [Tardiphaga sp. P9-11]KAA0078064.1 flagellar biosynthesis regulator FlaF [Tardiphaga sp. P9-11]